MLMTRDLDDDWMVKRTRSQSGDWRVRLSFPAENRSDKRERERERERELREVGGSANRSSKYNFLFQVLYTDFVESTYLNLNTIVFLLH